MAYYEGAAKKKAPPREADDHRCRVCKKPCGLSDNHGQTWFCAEHASAGFWPHDRKKAPPPAPVAMPESDEF